MAVSNVELRVDASQAVNQLKKTNAETKKLEQTVKDANGRLRDANGRFVSTGKAAGTATGNIQRLGIAFRTTLGPVVALYGAVTFLNRSLQVASQRQVDVAKLTNGLQNLGATASDLERLQVAADKFGNTTLFDQEDATQAFALLTSFQRIGVESYERVTKAASDLATITGQDLKSAQIQLAKALEDPTKRVTDLARSGTVFTDQQKEQIKVLQESGQLLEAQNLILSEIEKQYGGAAEAAGSAGLAGALDSLGEATRDFQEALGGTQSLIGGVTYVVNLLTEGVKGLEKGLKDADTIIKAVGILAERAGLGAIEFGKGVEFVKEAILNALPQLRLYLFALEQINKLAGKVVDSQSGQRNFGANYASQERALFEAAGGFNPYKSKSRVLPKPSDSPKPSKDLARQKAQEEKQRLSFLKQINAEIDRINQAELDGLEAGRKIVEQIDAQGAAEIKTGETNLALLQAKIDGRLEEEQLAQKIKAIEESNLNDVQKEKQIAIVKQTAALEKQIKAAEKLDQVYRSIGSAVSDGIVNALTAAVEGTKSLADVASQTLRQVANILLQFGVNTALGGLSTVGGTGSIFSKLFGGFRASGGTVTGGRSYMVGEKGPELFTPGRTGSIAPSGSFGGANVVVNVDASGSQAQGNQPNAKALGAAIGAAVQAELVKQKRPGGLLA